MLLAAQAPLWDRCENYLELSMAIESLSLKSDYNMPKGCFNCMVQMMVDALPNGHCNILCKKIRARVYKD